MARRRSRLFVPTGGAIAWVLGMMAVGPLVGGDPVQVAAQTVIEAAPGPVATWAIETFGSYAQPLLMIGVSIGIVAAGAGFGLLTARVDPGPRRRLQVAYALTLTLVLTTGGGFYVAGGGISTRWMLATILSIVPPGTVWWASAETGARPVGRRRALERMSIAGGSVLAGGVVAQLLGQGPPREGVQPGDPLDPVEEKTETGTTTPTPTATGDGDSLGTRSETDGVVVSSSTSDEAFGFDFEGIPALVGSAADHYVVDKNVSPPRVNTDVWSLSIGGAVEDGREYTFEELRTHPDRREMTVTMVCISNTVGGNLIGTTDWVAIPVRTLLEDAGVTETAVDVVTRAADGYSEAIPWSVVREREDIVLAVGMDGKTLPAEHGFPARLLIPGRYGMKSTKWVTDFELATEDHEAYWEQRGWDEEAVVNTLSYVRAVQRRGDRIAVGGIAYGGLRGIDRVEVSVDGGSTWADATLEDPVSSHARRRWRYVFDRPDTGPLDIVVRATDGEGNRQTSSQSPSHPGGSTGWHSVTVSL
ncbi:molybdopterin-dependent oxidoreductase [Halorhabdus amylolytica]|uniref:molybdopterin-dependent oxidoreductase n=1 Tax=Halorhabdus amylolytica TaxID=2559573 RepID=UPI0010AB4702|nr:molybdopterin-dependent oxidoreductase [Halorhabdus amylolytica]